MTKPLPYVALDIETTGLDPNAQVLQIAMIFDDLKQPIEYLEAHSFLVDNAGELYTGKLEPVSLSMNAWIYKEIAAEKSKHKIFTTGEARGHFHTLLLQFQQYSKPKTITFAGKNVQGFDYYHLCKNEFITETNKNMISHRMIDTGSLYLPDFGYIPNQNEINKLIGRKSVTHDAYDDAIDVVCAIRHKLKIGL